MDEVQSKYAKTMAQEMAEIIDLIERGLLDGEHIHGMMNIINFQRQEIENLRDALRPFAESYVKATPRIQPEDHWLLGDGRTGKIGGGGINMKHILDARAVYAATGPLPQQPTRTGE